MPKFLQMTEDRLAALLASRSELESGIDPVAALRDIGDLAHKISGTALSFEFNDLDEHARAVEEVCLEFRSSATCPDLPTTSELARHLDALEDELTRIVRPSGVRAAQSARSAKSET